MYIGVIRGQCPHALWTILKEGGLSQPGSCSFWFCKRYFVQIYLWRWNVLQKISFTKYICHDETKRAAPSYILTLYIENSQHITRFSQLAAIAWAIFLTLVLSVCMRLFVVVQVWYIICDFLHYVKIKGRTDIQVAQRAFKAFVCSNPLPVKACAH